MFSTLFVTCRDVQLIRTLQPLPQPISAPKKTNKKEKSQISGKLHRVETEQNPQKLGGTILDLETRNSKAPMPEKL